MDCDVSMDKIMRMPIFQLNYFIEQAEMRHYYVALTTRNGEIYTGKIQLLRNRQKVLVHKPNKNVIRYINLHDIYYVSRQD
ncbi:hypothetical protein FHQ08_05725 [Lactobacillus sp. CC-MHH1034]|uniref:Rho-binding antiterminator n=2 Tax=Agrilactobacillus fermenti TaxID=2586909 RepID=UPI001E304B3F|nr:Rho-binding antiterminator [Agrilactobacillus fermenti]MCD2256214.1 hypothetical protein [Agrilactobacillus fermenti]